MSNVNAKYYTPPGSYDGLVRLFSGWARVTELNRIDKTGWIRWQGPPSEAMRQALRMDRFMRAPERFPERLVKEF